MKRNKKFTVAVLILFLIEICRLCPSLAVWQKPESLPSSSSSEMPVSNNSAFIPAGFSTSVEEENINMEKKTINQDKTDSKTTTSNKDSEYLKPTKFAESDNQKIIDLANQITKDCTTDEEKAQKIFDIIFMKIIPTNFIIGQQLVL
ncbi:MAG: hypothetical protein N2606_00215 [Candidatus Omnitrophica bacterium]|nr:hypothetical protein [Candidatus Omnitrophota bacterium]